ncbi:hypothetical protein L2E82_24890 [Cichorium intybus]|uniref:Uncharacterized protein n=1 Tax=Cichorium intybus TaxID=13427 RepID=A0ACB9E254_CICIN|nr:hypothetical protein L2E82_24890 [Cichorium intybus]
MVKPLEFCCCRYCKKHWNLVTVDTAREFGEGDTQTLSNEEMKTDDRWGPRSLTDGEDDDVWDGGAYQTDDDSNGGKQW